METLTARNDQSLGQQRNQVIDILKLLFSVLIITLHIGDASNTMILCAIRPFARLGVPFFFANTALFAFSSSGNTALRVKKSLMHMLKLFFVWLIIYSPLIAPSFMQKGVYSFDFVLCAQSILFKCPGYLWYLPASIVGLIITYLFRSRQNFAIVIAGVLFVVGTIGNTYLSVFTQDESTLWYFRVFLTTRNGLFFSFPIMQITLSIKRSKVGSMLKKKSMVVIAFCIFLFEYILANMSWNTSIDKSMYITLPLIIAALCIFAENSRYHFIGSSNVLAEISTGIYLMQYGWLTVFTALFTLSQSALWLFTISGGVGATLLIRRIVITKKILL